jgi:hypothetical protein
MARFEPDSFVSTAELTNKQYMYIAARTRADHTPYQVDTIGRPMELYYCNHYCIAERSRPALE